jgi:hypothetical protein
LQRGPPLARVDGVERREAGDGTVAEGFSIS